MDNKGTDAALQQNPIRFFPGRNACKSSKQKKQARAFGGTMSARTPVPAPHSMSAAAGTLAEISKQFLADTNAPQRIARIDFGVLSATDISRLSHVVRTLVFGTMLGCMAQVMRACVYRLLMCALWAAWSRTPMQNAATMSTKRVRHTPSTTTPNLYLCVYVCVCVCVCVSECVCV
jgi:hypothetical protein